MFTEAWWPSGKASVSYTVDHCIILHLFRAMQGLHEMLCDLLNVLIFTSWVGHLMSSRSLREYSTNNNNGIDNIQNLNDEAQRKVKLFLKSR